jgi:hypothetical protein
MGTPPTYSMAKPRQPVIGDAAVEEAGDPGMLQRREDPALVRNRRTATPAAPLCLLHP